jgi:hypothetical protein
MCETTNTFPELRIPRVALPFLLPWDSYPKVTLFGYNTQVPSPAVRLWSLERDGRRWPPRI